MMFGLIRGGVLRLRGIRSDGGERGGIVVWMVG